MLDSNLFTPSMTADNYSNLRDRRQSAKRKRDSAQPQLIDRPYSGHTRLSVQAP